MMSELLHVKLRRECDPKFMGYETTEEMAKKLSEFPELVSEQKKEE